MSGSGFIPRTPPAYLESYERDQAADAAELESYEQPANTPRATDDDESAFLAGHLS